MPTSGLQVQAPGKREGREPGSVQAQGLGKGDERVGETEPGGVWSGPVRGPSGGGLAGE